MFIVKINNFAVKQRILKAKINKDVRLRDVTNLNASDGNPLIFINNHVTPYFGKLLAEGRKAVKDKKIHSVWFNRNGCKLRLEANGPERVYRNMIEFNGLISSHLNRTSDDRADSQSKRSRPDDEISPGSRQRSKK